MNTATKAALWAAIESYMKKNNLNMAHLAQPSKRPFPCGSRWISALKHSVDNKTDQNFQKSLCIQMFNFLQIPIKLDGGVIVICENSN